VVLPAPMGPTMKMLVDFAMNGYSGWVDRADRDGWTKILRAKRGRRNLRLDTTHPGRL